MMKALVLQKVGSLAVETVPDPVAGADEVALPVAYCSICRTDAKMWREGQRDLRLPRILGHECVCVAEQSGRFQAVWPASACGKCRFCRDGRENLCESMAIIGFSRDGALAERLRLPDSSLFNLPHTDSPWLFCLAEPLACVLNALELTAPYKSALVIGAGPLGLMAAAAVDDAGRAACVLERNERKIEKCRGRSGLSGIRIAAVPPPDEHFDLVLNATSSPDAFADGLAYVLPGGSCSFFSGLPGDGSLPHSLLNLIHYKQLRVSGAYGCRRCHIERACNLIQRRPDFFEALVEKIVTLAEVQALLPEVLSGERFKYIVAMSKDGVPV